MRKPCRSSASQRTLFQPKPECECTKQERFRANSPASECFTAGNSVATTSLLDIKPGGFGDATFCSIFATSREKFDLFTENLAPLLCIFLTFSSHFPQVSWIRKRDLHILTTGASSYTSDQRFQVTNDWHFCCSSPCPRYLFVVSFLRLDLNWAWDGFIACLAFLPLMPLSFSSPSQVIRSHDLGNWTLQIKYPHLRDNGVYECQINTEPKMSLSYVLNVVGEWKASQNTAVWRACCDNCFKVCCICWELNEVKHAGGAFNRLLQTAEKLSVALIPAALLHGGVEEQKIH